MQRFFPHPLTSIIQNQAERIMRMTCQERAILDVGRPVKALVRTGFGKYLSKDAEFMVVWLHFLDPNVKCPENIMVQDWELERSMDVYQEAMRVYTERGIMMPQGTPHDAGDDEDE